MTRGQYIILGSIAVACVLFAQTQAEFLIKESLDQIEAQMGKIDCPTRISSEPDNGRSKMFLYSPNDRSDIGITYKGSDWADDDINKLIEEGFSFDKPTIIVLHAYRESYRSKWLKNVREQFNNKFNLLFFDWSSYSKQPYSISVSWVPHLAKVVSRFLNKLIKIANYDMKKVQLVSFSMSTHISGLASRQMPPGKRVSKILALDPAGPCFHDETSIAENFALRSTDADLVVSQIYDFNGVGPKKTIGGVEIFVNGGSSQPINKQNVIKAGEFNGRDILERDDGSVERNPLMNHLRATEHAAQKSDETCQQVAYSCPSYKAFLRGWCASCGKTGEDCYNMDAIYEFESNPKFSTNTKMFIRTGSTKYCLHHYQVILRMKSKIFSNYRRLVDSGAVTVDFSSGFKVKPRYRNRFSGKFTTLGVRSERLEIPKKIIVNVDPSAESRELVSLITRIELNYMSQISAEERSRGSAVFCNTLNSNEFVRC